MLSIFVEFPKTEMKFYLFDDEVDNKMKKKLSRLSLVELGVDFPEDQNEIYVKGKDGLYRAGEISKNGFRVSRPTDDSKFKTVFEPEDNSIFVYLEGRFFCINTLDEVDSIDDWRSGYVGVVRLNNEKGNLIKKPKDQWGLSVPIEALAEKGVYGGGAHQVLFRVHVERGAFYG